MVSQFDDLKNYLWPGPQNDEAFEDVEERLALIEALGPLSTDEERVDAIADALSTVMGSAAWTNARVPLAHKTTHQSGGSDELVIAQAQVTGLVAALTAKMNSGDAVTQAQVTGLVAALASKMATGDTIAQSQVTGLVAALLAIQTPVGPNTQAVAAYTLAITDYYIPGVRSGVVEMNYATANAITLPQDSAVAIPIGSSGEIRQVGAGKTTVVQGTGATIRKTSATLDFTAQWGVVGWTKRAANEFLVGGELT